MKLLLELSGENPTIPFAEIDCIGTVLDQRAQVAVVDCPKPAEASRLAMTHRVMEYLGECDASVHAFSRLLKRSTRSPAVAAKCMPMIRGSFKGAHNRNSNG